MNIIAWIFYIIQRVMVVPMGSVNELKRTEEDANKWYKDLDNPDNKLHNIKTKVFDFWAFKLLLLVSSIWLVPYLRDIYNGVKTEKELFQEEKEQ